MIFVCCAALWLFTLLLAGPWLMAAAFVVGPLCGAGAILLWVVVLAAGIIAAFSDSLWS